MRLLTRERKVMRLSNSHLRLSRVRMVDTVFVPRLAVITTWPLQPCEGATVVGRRRRPVARKLYGARRSRLGASCSAGQPRVAHVCMPMTNKRKPPRPRHPSMRS